MHLNTCKIRYSRRGVGSSTDQINNKDNHFHDLNKNEFCISRMCGNSKDIDNDNYPCSHYTLLFPLLVSSHSLPNSFHTSLPKSAPGVSQW